MSLIPGIGGHGGGLFGLVKSPLSLLTGGAGGLGLLSDVFEGKGLGGILSFAGHLLESPIGQAAASSVLGPLGPAAAKLAGGVLEQEGAHVGKDG